MTHDEKIDALALGLGCRVERITGAFPEMYVEYEPPLVLIPPIRTQFDYLVALHELGHVVHGHTQGHHPFEHKRRYFDNGVLRSEAQAWLWAISAADETLTPQTLRDARRYFQTYLDDAELSRYLPGWHLVRVQKGGRWDSPAFQFDRPDSAEVHSFLAVTDG